MGPGASPGSSQPYFSYDFYTEVCRASIEAWTWHAQPSRDRLPLVYPPQYSRHVKPMCK